MLPPLWGCSAGDLSQATYITAQAYRGTCPYSSTLPLNESHGSPDVSSPRQQWFLWINVRYGTVVSAVQGKPQERISWALTFVPTTSKSFRSFVTSRNSCAKVWQKIPWIPVNIERLPDARIWSHPSTCYRTNVSCIKPPPNTGRSGCRKRGLFLDTNEHWWCNTDAPWVSPAPDTRGLTSWNLLLSHVDVGPAFFPRRLLLLQCCLASLINLAPAPPPPSQSVFHQCAFATQ